MNKKKIMSVVLVVMVAVAMVFGVAMAAKIWSVPSSDGTKVVRVDQEGSSFKVDGYNAAAPFDGVGKWYRDCNYAISRVYVKQKANGIVQVICISAYPTPAPPP